MNQIICNNNQNKSTMRTNELQHDKPFIFTLILISMHLNGRCGIVVTIFVGTFIMSLILLLDIRNIQGQNNTLESILSSHMVESHTGGGLLILDTGGWSNNFCLYGSNLYSAGAKVMVGDEKLTCLGDRWY